MFRQLSAIFYVRIKRAANKFPDYIFTKRTEGVVCFLETKAKYIKLSQSLHIPSFFYYKYLPLRRFLIGD